MRFQNGLYFCVRRRRRDPHADAKLAALAIPRYLGPKWSQIRERRLISQPASRCHLRQWRMENSSPAGLRPLYELLAANSGLKELL